MIEKQMLVIKTKDGKTHSIPVKNVSITVDNTTNTILLEYKYKIGMEIDCDLEIYHELEENYEQLPEFTI